MYNKITSTRLVSQQLAEKQLHTPKELVAYMGAVQAQDFNAAKMAVGLRLPQVYENEIVEAFNKGEILRTHVLRPTWHFVSPDNIRQMLALSAKRNKAAGSSRDRELEITEKLYEQSNEILRNSLKNRRYLTRNEIAAELEQHKIVVDSARLYHFLYRAEIDAVICSGALRGKEQTYALLDERVPPATTNNTDAENFLPKLLNIYFRSHSPATLNDFSWWSGMPLTEIRQALEEAKPHLQEEKIDGQTYYIHNEIADTQLITPSVFLLPAFDEYLIAYSKRTAVLIAENNAKAVSSNGIFRPVIVVNGQVCGVWHTVGTKKNIVLEWFNQPDGKTLKLSEKAIDFIKEFNRI
jgi:hypothetical protein